MIEAAQIKDVNVSTLAFFRSQMRQSISQPLCFKEAGGLWWVTKASLQEWHPKPYRHLRPQNISRKN